MYIVKNVMLAVGEVQRNFNDITKGQATGKNLFTITRFCYIELLFHVFCGYWSKENRSLYQGPCYMEVLLNTCR